MDCHLPQEGVEKWVSKEPIEITPADRQVVQGNCLRCHGAFVHAVAASPRPADPALRCTHCHGGAG